MRLTRLTASKVHGFLPIDVEFDPKLTFLIGLNGSGKTSALRLLMGLLTPSVDELAKIEFSRAEVRIQTDAGEVSISAERDQRGLTLRTTGVEGELLVDAPSLEIITAPSRRDEERVHPLFRSILQNDVFVGIRKIATPMFLGLERRLFQEDRFMESNSELARRRDILVRRQFFEEIETLSGVTGAGLADVLILVRDTMSEIRAKQEKLDRDLRERLLMSAVRFTPTEFDTFQPPSMDVINRYRSRREELREAAKLLRLPLDDMQVSLDTFFRKMDELGSKLVGKNSKKNNNDGKTAQDANSLMTWLINKNQVDRILENFKQFETYATDRESLHSTIDRLLELLNKFLVQTGKCVEITDSDRLIVRRSDGKAQSPAALSSGERQLCIMLGHLSLNPLLSGSGVFIVDEPELSLHLSWQEIFVDSVRAANSDVQLIFATHSPAIILDKESNCRSLQVGRSDVA
jgi:energy-coupling factor transporter ATP-binding protein EcfA2